MEDHVKVIDSADVNEGYEDLIQLVKLADSFSTFYEGEKQKLPFHINIIDEIYADENAHTRILLHLLKYESGGEYIFLKSFIEQMGSDCKTLKQIIHKPRITFNEQFDGRYIDGLIEEKGKYAIIIENKIHGAIDQKNQIEDYVNSVKCISNTPIENICVVYLTKDGQKIVGGDSLSSKMHRDLGGRFVKMNYREVILPWLRDELLPNCKIKENWLASAILQYIDHLEGMFGMRRIEQSMNTKINDYLMEQLGITNLDYGNSLDQIEVVQRNFNKIVDSIESTKRSLIKRIWDGVFISQLKEIGKELEVEEDGVECSSAEISCERYQGFGFRPKNWSRATIYFEFQSPGYRDLIVGAHKNIIDSNPYDDAQINEALTKICGKTTDSNRVWFCWKNMDKCVRWGGDEFIKKIITGELKEVIKNEVNKFITSCARLNM